MEVRYFSPIVFTNDASGIILGMEKIGFVKTHVKEDIAGTGVVSITMKDAKGNPFAIVQGPRFPQTFSGLRINVDDFDEALASFMEVGFTNINAESNGSSFTNTGSSKAALIRSPEGVFVSLAEHLK